MRIYLYQLIGDKRYLDNTPFIRSLGSEGDPVDEEGAFYFPAEIMEDTSVIDPTFVLSYHYYFRDWNNGQMCNYLWCQDTLRWYYVTDVTLSQNKVYMKCHVDVLMTYRNAIADKNAIIKRTNAVNKMSRNTRYNKYLNDDKFMAYAPEVTYIQSFPTNKGFSNKVAEFVMCVVGSPSGNNSRNSEEVDANAER